MNKFFLLLSGTFMVLTIAAQKNPCNTDGRPYSQLPGDTTITLSSGTTITFNRCEFFDVRDCIQITEITDPEQLMAEGSNMYDEKGNILITCGMLKIDMKDCGRNCFEIPIKFKLRVRFPDCSGQPNELPGLYLNSGNGWTRPKTSASQITTVNNVRYIEFSTPCPVKLINCDLPKRGRKVKFIAPKGNTISRLRTGITCPLFYSDEKFSTPKRKVKIRLLCSSPERVKIQSLQLTATGDSLGTKEVTLSSLQHGKRKIDCDEPKRSFFGKLFAWLSPHYGPFYRKYYLPSL
jgi:hypothetical protein